MILPGMTTTNAHLNPGVPNHEHNIRDEKVCSKAKHIDFKHEHAGCFFEILQDIPVRDRYETVFEDPILEYNAKQKRADRKLTVDSYMKSIENDTRGKRQTHVVNGKRVPKEDPDRIGKQLVYEVILTVGNTICDKDESGKRIYKENGHEQRSEQLPRSVQREVMRRFTDEFEDRYPNMRMCTAVIHGDEGYYNKKGVWEWGDVQEHLTFFPVADDFKQGLSVQNSMNKALKQMGFGMGYVEFERDMQNRLAEITQDVFEDYCKIRGYDHKEITFYHPITEKKRKGDMDKETFIKEQELAEAEADLGVRVGRCKAKEKALKDKEDKLDKREESLDKREEDLKKATDDLDRINKQIADAQKQLDEIQGEVTKAFNKRHEGTSCDKFKSVMKKLEKTTNSIISEQAKPPTIDPELQSLRDPKHNGKKSFNSTNSAVSEFKRQVLDERELNRGPSGPHL